MDKLYRLARFWQKHYQYALLIFLACAFFNEFFLKGYLLEGTGDRIRSMVPLETYALRSVHAGHLPEWNPYIGCGVQYLSNGYHNFFYPLKLLIYSFPENMLLLLLTLSAVLHMILSGLFFLLFARTVIKERFWQLISAIAYMLSFTLTYNCNYGDDCVIPLVWAPLFLYLVNSAGHRSLLKNFALMTLTLSLILVGGNLQLILFVTALLILYAVYKTMVFRGGKLGIDARILSAVVLSCLAAGLITAARTVPFLFYLKECQGALSSGSFEDLVKFDLTKPAALLRLFVPFFFTGDNSFFIAGLGPPISFNIYFGVLSAYLIIYTFVFIWDRETVFWKAVIIGIILMILGTPLARFQFDLLGKTYLTFSRYAWLLPIPLALFVGLAGPAMTAEGRRLGRNTLFVILVFLSVAALLYLVYHNTYELFHRIAFVNPGVYDANKDIFSSLMQNMKNSTRYFSIGTLCVLLILLVTGRKGYGRFGKYFIITFISIDLFSMSRANITSAWNFLSPDPFRTVSEAESFVVNKFSERGRSFRILGNSNNTDLDTCIHIGLYKPSAWGATLPWDIVMLCGLENATRIKLLGAFPDDPRIRELTSVAYRLDKDGSLITYPNYLPRVKLFSDYRVEPDPKKARAVIRDSSFGIYRTLVLEARPAILPSPVPVRDTAKIVSDDNEMVTISVDAERSALLLLNDSYDKGWSAFIDGKPQKIYKANLAFKAVEVPQGKHTVVFRYGQPGVLIGLIVTAASVFLLLLSAAFHHFFKKH